MCKSANSAFKTAAINAFRTFFFLFLNIHAGFTYSKPYGVTFSVYASQKSSCSEVGRWLHLLHGLTFLHHVDVAEAFAFNIMDCAPTPDKTKKCADYFYSTYVETAMFLPSLLAQISSDVHRTINGPESFHRYFCCHFMSPHPTFYIFWDSIVR
jgi:hypothetical protein